MNANLRNFALWVIIVLLLLALFTLFQNPGQRASSQDISFSQLLTEVDQNHVRDVVIQGQEIHGTFTNGSSFQTYAPNDPTLVKRGQEGFHLAEFRRSLVPESVDGAQQQPKANLLRQGGEGCGLEAARLRPVRRITAIPQAEEPLGAVGQHLDCGVGPGEPCREPHQIAGIAAFRRELRQ